MIALLRGLVADRGDDHIVVDVQGVGYRVFVPGPLARSLQLGEETRLFIHTHVREDAIHLFGFGVPLQRRLFLSLTTVKGIGPKLAMTVLANATTADLVQAVSSGDVRRLTKIKGLGKKTAERVLVELQTAFEALALEVAPAASDQKPTRDGMLADVASALANLGFKPAEIDRALDAVREQPGAPKDFDGLFREAMKNVR